MHRTPDPLAGHSGAQGFGHGAIVEGRHVRLIGPHSRVGPTEMVFHALPELGLPHDQAAALISTGANWVSATAIRSLTEESNEESGSSSA